MTFRNLLLFIILVGCHSPSELPPEPKLVLNQHAESLELKYDKDSEKPTNLNDINIKTKEYPIRGRTSHHVYFPAYSSESLTQKRVVFLKNHLEERGFKSFQFKTDDSLNSTDTRLRVKIRTFNVMLPRHNNGTWTQRMSIMANELAMLEDITVLFDDSDMPNINAASSSEAVKNYGKPKATDAGGGLAGAGGALANVGTGIAQTALSGALPK